MELTRTIILLFIFSMITMASCGESTAPAIDTAVEDGMDTADTAADVLPDPHPDVVPDVAPDIPVDPVPDIIPDVMPDYPHDIPQDYHEDVWPDYPYDIYDIPPDYPHDIPYDHSCVGQGCLVGMDGGRCCPGLTPASECDPSSSNPECMIFYCINCGNGTCDAHENCYNCPYDCINPCSAGIGMGYSCGMFETHSCSCEVDECVPACISSSDGDMAWYDPCAGVIIRPDDDCMGQTALCGEICSRSEGWYESRSGELIAWDSCSNHWECTVIW